MTTDYKKLTKNATWNERICEEEASWRERAERIAESFDWTTERCRSSAIADMEDTAFTFSSDGSGCFSSPAPIFLRSRRTVFRLQLSPPPAPPWKLRPVYELRLKGFSVRCLAYFSPPSKSDQIHYSIKIKSRLNYEIVLKKKKKKNQ